MKVFQGWGILVKNGLLDPLSHKLEQALGLTVGKHYYTPPLLVPSTVGLLERLTGLLGFTASALLGSGLRTTGKLPRQFGKKGSSAHI